MVSVASRIMNNYQLFTVLFSMISTKIIYIAQAAEMGTTQQRQAQGTVSNGMPCLCLNLL